MPRRPRIRISLDLLRGFDAAARHLSFTRAAKERFLTQSAVSREIKTLEEQLQRPLFVRVNRGLVLTAAGQALHAVVEEALASIDAAVERLAVHDGPALSLTCSQAVANLWLAPRLADFAAANPGVAVRVVAGDRVVGDLDHEGLQLAIRHARRPPSGAVLRLAGERVLPVCAPAIVNGGTHPLRSPGDLAHHVLLHFDTVDRGWPLLVWSTWLKTLGVGAIEPAGSMRFSHYDALIGAALAGAGVAVGRQVLLSRQLAARELVAAFDAPAVPFGAYYLVRAAGAKGRVDVDAFVNWIAAEMKRDEASTLPGQGAD